MGRETRGQKVRGGERGSQFGLIPDSDKNLLPGMYRYLPLLEELTKNIVPKGDFIEDSSIIRTYLVLGSLRTRSTVLAGIPERKKF
jgi:hypothetical protein